GGWRVARGDITRIPLRSDTFDMATSFDVLQCVEGDEAAVREMARIVRPGGVVLLTVAALEMLRGEHAEFWREVHRYTPPHATRLMEQAGLHVEQVSYMFASTFPLMLVTRIGQRLSRRFRSPRADTDIGVPREPVNAILSALVSAEASLAQRVG